MQVRLGVTYLFGKDRNQLSEYIGQRAADNQPQPLRMPNLDTALLATWAYVRIQKEAPTLVNLFSDSLNYQSLSLLQSLFSSISVSHNETKIVRHFYAFIVVS